VTRGTMPLDAAIAASALGTLTSDTITALVEDARKIAIPAGTTIHHEGEIAPHLELVLHGLVRVCVSSPDGRMMTVRYCRRGALIGVATLFASGGGWPFSIQAVTASELLRFRPATVRAASDRDVRVARALLKETSERVVSFVEELSGSAFATVRQRLARHLLDLVSEHQQGPDLVARLTQQELADAIGSVREVVVRVLRELREDDIVRTGRDGIRILDPEKLLRTADTDGT
jgi:CRP/FNR family transcriptional regulator, cyclic AMP receptor protein